MKIRGKMKYSVTCRQKIATLAVLMAICFCVPVAAETGYVTDMLVLTMRSGPGDGYPVVKTLTSNTVVEILEKGAVFDRVRSGDGDEGWVKNRYLTDDLPDPLVIEGLKKKIAELEALGSAAASDRSSLSGSMETLSKGYEEKLAVLESSRDKAVSEKNRLAADLDRLSKTHEQFLKMSKDTVAVIEANRTLKEQNLALSSELETFKTAGTDFLKTAMVKWFLAGAGVLIAGWLIGRISGSSRRSSRY